MNGHFAFFRTQMIVLERAWFHKTSEKLMKECGKVQLIAIAVLFLMKFKLFFMESLLSSSV